MYLDVQNFDKNDKNTRRTIYEEIDELYFGEVKIFYKEFLDHCKNNTNTPQNIPSRIKNNVFRCSKF